MSIYRKNDNIKSLTEAYNKMYSSDEDVQGIEEIHDMPDQLDDKGVPSIRPADKPYPDYEDYPRPRPTALPGEKPPQEPVGRPRQPGDTVDEFGNPIEDNTDPIQDKLPLEYIVPFLQDLYDKMTNPNRMRR